MMIKWLYFRFYLLIVSKDDPRSDEWNVG